jgi:hypothetical protein
MADDGFVSRWSKRKAQARAREAVEDEAVVEPEEALKESPSPQPSPAGGRGSEEASDAPTLEETNALTFDSDFKRFLAPDVAPEVKNAAVRKLFADPRFNVRDMMDVYADDYTQPDPLPEPMLRQLAAARVLKLFEEKTDDEGGQTVAHSAHADPDLRLQQDDAPAGPGAGEGVGDGAEPDAAAAHEPVPPRGGGLPEGGER